MMTNEQHDDAWLDVMTKRVSNMDVNLELLTKSVYYRNMLEYYKELYKIDKITTADYVEILKFMGEEQKFT